MADMDEARIYDDRRRETVAYLATGRGVATVQVASDRVGRFALVHRCVARDVAAAADRVYAATPEGVLATDAAWSDAGAAGERAAPDRAEFESLGFPDAVAVTMSDGAVLAADADGTVARHRDDAWEAVGAVEEVRALSNDLVAASDGVYRPVGGDLRNVGLDAVRDVAGTGVPLAATDDGLYRLGNGWLSEREGTFAVVGAGIVDGGPEERAHAATAETLYARDGDEWGPVDLPVEGTVADVAYGECVYTVTEDGTFLVEADPERTADGTGGWRHRSLGLPEVAALAVV